jgi:hypothetical protein
VRVGIFSRRGAELYWLSRSPPGLIAGGERIMKVILTALLALSVLTGVTLSVASAADEYDYPSDVFKKIERNLP